jgi:hypothetical protein
MMELSEIPADGVYGDVRVLEAEALARNPDPGDPGLGDVERSHTQRLPVHVHLCVLLQTENTLFFIWHNFLAVLRIRDVYTGSEFISSQIRIFYIPDPGSRGQKGTGSRIKIRNTDFW